jgi:hypothetical protein
MVDSFLTAGNAQAGQSRECHQFATQIDNLVSNAIATAALSD